MYSCFPCGFLFNNASVGGSVARARAARVSIIKLIHNIYTVDKIASFKITADINVAITAATLTVN